MSAQIDAVDEAGFWRAVAALLELLPAAAQLGVSAWSGPPPPDGFWADPLLTSTPSTRADDPRRSDGAGLLKKVEHGPVDGPAFRYELIRRLSRVVHGQDAAHGAEAYFTRMAAPAPDDDSADAALLSAQAAVAELERAARGAAEMMETDRRDGEDFGAARAVGWLAARLDAETLWPRLQACGAPMRWRSLSLAEPVDAAPSLSLYDLAMLHKVETAVRAAAPDAVETPFDAPVFKARRARAADLAPRLLTADPLALLITSNAGFATDVKSALQEGRVDPRPLATSLDAIAFAAELPPRETDEATLQALAEAGSALRRDGGLAAIGRYDKVNVAATEPVAARYFGGLWLRALEFELTSPQAPSSGPAFWRDRWLAWVAAQGGDGAAIDPVRRALRNAAVEAGPAGVAVLAEPLIATLGAPEPTTQPGGAKQAAKDGETARDAARSTRRAAPPAPQAAQVRDQVAEAMRALRQSQSDTAGGGAADPSATEDQGFDEFSATGPAAGAGQRGVENEPEVERGRRGAKAERAGRKPSRMGANVDRAALDEAVSLFTRYGDDLAAEGARRADGAEGRPVALALTDKQRAAAALDAA
ncbi:MAG: hypothetical protein AAF909_15590, partial [Pseudomonadota bacterium]